MPFIHLLKKYNFPALPEDVELARHIAGRDSNGDKGGLKLSTETYNQRGVYARGLVGKVEKMPLLVRQPKDDDYKPEVIEIVI